MYGKISNIALYLVNSIEAPWKFYILKTQLNSAGKGHKSIQFISL